MKTIKFIVSQLDTVFTTTFELNEDKAKDLNLIIGTGINHVNRKMLLARKLGANILNGSKPVTVKIVAENFELDTKMLDAGLVGMTKELSVTIKAGYSEKNQKRFAVKVWAAMQIILAKVELRTISEVTGENEDQILIPEMAEGVKVEPVVKVKRGKLVKA
jgi:hypothetical protein